MCSYSARELLTFAGGRGAGAGCRVSGIKAVRRYPDAKRRELRMANGLVEVERDGVTAGLHRADVALTDCGRRRWPLSLLDEAHEQQLLPLGPFRTAHRTLAALRLTVTGAAAARAANWSGTGRTRNRLQHWRSRGSRSPRKLRLPSAWLPAPGACTCRRHWWWPWPGASWARAGRPSMPAAPSLSARHIGQQSHRAWPRRWR